MPKARNIGGVRGQPYMGAGGHFTPGCWRPDAPDPNAVALPSGPDADRPTPPPDNAVSERDARPRDPRTAANMAAHQAALAPRRWTPPSQREG